MNHSEILDVTKIEPRLKHPTIFDRFDNLGSGDALLIHNDHDPKPLYYQLLGERGNCFSWTYQVNGPEVWEVEIRKNDPGKRDETLGEIVKKDIRKAEVFKRLGLDFCCGGRKSLKDACLEKGLDIEQVKTALDNANDQGSSASKHDFDSWTLSFLADYIVNVHHAYVKQNLPVLEELSHKVANRHGDDHPELITISILVDEMAHELKTHMKKEELILFPYIKQLEERGEHFIPSFSSIEEPIAVMHNDHDIVGDITRQINILSDNYTLPANACNSYALLYKKLEDFEDDLHMHIHLENNILFPRAIEMQTNA